jgi:TonB family protein
MSRVQLVGASRFVAVVMAVCGWLVAAPASAQVSAQPQVPAAAPVAQANVTIPAVQLRQLLRGELADVFDQALVTQWSLETLQKEQQSKPTDIRPSIQIAAYYSLQNDIAKTVEYLAVPAGVQPDNPETCCLIASYLFGIVAPTERQEQRLSPENVSRAMLQVDRVLRMNAQYLPALLYKAMLLVVQAGQEQDPAKQAAIRENAQAVRSRFSTLARAAGTASAPEPIPVAGPSFPTGPNTVRVGGNIPAPVRTFSVEPVYPEAARQAGVQGVVILEALVGEDGKVQGTRILRSIPMLDNAAAVAVQQWTFAPTVVQGVPMKVIMTCTVNFTPKAPAEK